MAASLCEQYATVWPDDGSRQIASAICTAESGGNPQAHCASCAGVPEDSRGLWQINTRAWTNFDPNALFDPAYNAQAAFTVYQQQGWRAWSTYSGGKYLAYMDGGGDGSLVAPPAPAPIVSLPAIPSITIGRTTVPPEVLAGAAVVAALYLMLRS